MKHEPVLAARGATLLERTWAYLIDSLVTLLLWGGLSFLIAGGSLEALTSPTRVAVVAGFLFLLVPFTYFVLLEGLLATTLGKAAMGLALHHEEGGPCGLFDATVRNVLRLAWTLGPAGPLFLLLDVLLIQLTEREQRVGDVAAGTVVVRTSHPRLPVVPVRRSRTL